MLDNCEDFIRLPGTNDEMLLFERLRQHMMDFTQNKCCGKCVPCREGTKRMVEILERICSGQGEDGDSELLLELADIISATALCRLGKTAVLPVISGIKSFCGEEEVPASESSCPEENGRKLKIIIDPSICKGCSKCSRNCPVNAISGKIKEPFVIDQTKCVQCETCIGLCPFHAIRED